MSDRPTLLFLHGVGDGDPEDLWLTHLDEALKAIGYPGMSDVEYLAPKYAHALKGIDNPVPPLPPVTISKLGREDARANRREFERRISAAESRFGRHNSGTRRQVVDIGVQVAVMHSKFEQARNYVGDQRIRAQVLSRILPLVPNDGRLFIVGHSLGSVIAADLIPRLPPTLEVTGAITMGSPLANGSLNVKPIIDSLTEPPTNLAWWLNFWNAADPVASYRGLSSVIPWLLDFRIDSVKTPLEAHSASYYLRHPAVATAIGFGVHGSLSRELARANPGVVDVALELPEQLALIALRYGHLIKNRLNGDIKNRYEGALRHVQAAEIQRLSQLRREAQRGIPDAISRLDVELTDPRSSAEEPHPVGYFSREDAIIPLLVLAATNIIQPFEIDVPKDVFREALRDLTGELGLTSQFGLEVIESTKKARAVLNGPGDFAWIRWAALGAGAAAIVVATGGLALAAAPGLAGAAAITSALATFGPGGMVGGLLTAGTLVSAGGGGIALGLASSGTSAEAFEEVVERRLAAAILRKRLSMEKDPGIWRTLVEVEMELRREHEKLDEFSDGSASTLKALVTKLGAVERALKYLTTEGLAPNPEEELLAQY